MGLALSGTKELPDTTAGAYKQFYEIKRLAFPFVLERQKLRLKKIS